MGLYFSGAHQARMIRTELGHGLVAAA